MPQPTDEPAPRDPSHLRILLIDDDPAIGDALGAFFELQGWTLLVDATGEEGLARMKEDRALDLILLDVHLPGMSGFDVLEQSQAAGVVAPVLMVSTNAEDQARLRALGLGAQDYFVKPFEPDALRERIELITGLAPLPSPSRHVEVGAAVLDLDQHKLYRAGGEAKLTDVQFDLLRVLAEHRGEAVPRKRLLLDALGIDRDELMFTITLKVIYDSLDKHVEQLREIVEPDPKHPTVIETVFGQGYRLV